LWENDGNARFVDVADDLVQHRKLFSATGYNSADDPTLLIGLAHHHKVELIEITWPNGKVRAVQNVKAGMTLTITESG
jgi:hypothetical protein